MVSVWKSVASELPVDFGRKDVYSPYTLAKGINSVLPHLGEKVYYILQCYESEEDDGSYMEIADAADDIYRQFQGWGVGKKKDSTSIPEGHIVIDAVPYDRFQGEPLELSDGLVPLMSDRLKQAIVRAGVDNIDFYPVDLKNTDSGEIYKYHAFNLIGLVSATDLQGSDITSYDGDFIGDSSIKNFVLDQSKGYNLLMFRLAEKFSAILVHESVRKHIESSEINTLTFMVPEDYYHL